MGLMTILPHPTALIDLLTHHYQDLPLWGPSFSCRMVKVSFLFISCMTNSLIYHRNILPSFNYGYGRWSSYAPKRPG